MEQQEQPGIDTGVENTEEGFRDYVSPSPILYRKKPVVISALGFGVPDDATPIIDWIIGDGGTARFVGEDEPHPMRYDDDNDDTQPFIVIDTLEGAHRANLGDYIIKGIKGEFYPCKPDIFTDSYEKE